MSDKTTQKAPKKTSPDQRVLVLASKFKGLKNIRLQLAEWNVLLKIDGHTGTHEIARQLGISAEELHPVIEKFMKMGLVQEVGFSGDNSAGQSAGAADSSAAYPPGREAAASPIAVEFSREKDQLSLDELLDLSKNDQVLSKTLRAILSEPLPSPVETAGLDQESAVAPGDGSPPADVVSPSVPESFPDRQTGGKKETPVAPEPAVLRAEKLVKIYGKRRVVNEVSLQVTQGQVVGLLGPNGAGKTTSFYMITGFIAPNGGKIFLNKKDITSLPMYKRARRGMAYLPQEASIFRKLTVEENLLAIMEALGFPRKMRRQRSQELMEELRITHIAKNKGYNLSGGERRRTEIARALVHNPKFILLDEPFAGVDPIAVQDIQNIIISLKQKNIGILITDHNVQETLSITDHAYLLFEGKVLKEGDSDFIANDPEAQKLYLGEKFRLLR